MIMIMALVLTGCHITVDDSTNEREVFGAYSKEELEADANQLLNIIKSYSPMLYTDEEELTSKYDYAVSQLEDDMTGLEFVRLMKPVIAAIRCGHTHIYANWNWDAIILVPLGIKVIDGRLFVADSAIVTKIPMGSEVLSINGNPSADILEKMLNGISADGYNETSKIDTINRMFPREYMFHIEYVNDFEVKYITPDGAVKTDTVSGMNSDRVRNKLWKSSSKLFESEFHDDYAVLTVRSFNPNSRNTIEDYNGFFDEFFKELSQKGITEMILDVRGNSGGDPKISSHLFSYLQKEPQPYFAPESPNYYPGLEDPLIMPENNYMGNLYTLIDGGCFSSAGHFLSLLKYHEIGTMIGVESGAHYVCTDSSRDRTLKNTGINLHYSTEAWKVAVEGLEPGRGIMPDHEISVTIEDYIEDNDPAMDYALSLINK
jgi:hypothetical protein